MSNNRTKRIVILGGGFAVVLPDLGEKLAAYAQKKLAQRGVEIRLNTRVNGMTARTVELSDGTTIESSTVVSAARTAPNPLLKDLPKERGRLAVNQFLELVGWPGVWALGDRAALPDASTGKTSPPTAQYALREGRVLARNITADIRGQSKRPFVFSTVGQLAAIGKRTGVANILRLHRLVALASHLPE
jgi:NADH:ubiquinone reductase (H+-translocating)